MDIKLSEIRHAIKCTEILDAMAQIDDLVKGMTVEAQLLGHKVTPQYTLQLVVTAMQTLVDGCEAQLKMGGYAAYVPLIYTERNNEAMVSLKDITPKEFMKEVDTHGNNKSRTDNKSGGGDNLQQDSGNISSAKLSKADPLGTR